MLPAFFFEKYPQGILQFITAEFYWYVMQEVVEQEIEYWEEFSLLSLREKSKDFW